MLTSQLQITREEFQTRGVYTGTTASRDLRVKNVIIARLA